MRKGGGVPFPREGGKGNEGLGGDPVDCPFPPRDGGKGMRGEVGSGAGGPGSGTPRDLDGSALCARLGSASRVGRLGHANAPVARASSPPPGPPAPLHIQTVRRRSEAPATHSAKEARKREGIEGLGGGPMDHPGRSRPDEPLHRVEPSEDRTCLPAGARRDRGIGGRSCGSSRSIAAALPTVRARPSSSSRHRYPCSASAKTSRARPITTSGERLIASRCPASATIRQMPSARDASSRVSSGGTPSSCSPET